MRASFAPRLSLAVRASKGRPATQLCCCTDQPGDASASGGATSSRWSPPGYEVIVARPARATATRDLSADDVVRPRRLQPRPAPARARRARATSAAAWSAATSAASIGVDLRAPLPGLRRQARLLRHRAADAASTTSSPPASTSARITRHRRRTDGRLPPPPGRDARRARRRARHAGEAPALHRRDVRPPPVGVAGHVHRRPTSTS